MCFLQETEQSINQTIPPPPTLTRALNAISQYPIIRHLITHLPRKDVYNLALSHPAIYYTLNLQSRASRKSVLARCIRTCSGPPCWGFPQDMCFIKPKQHKALEEDPNEDMDVQICAREGCWRDSCKHCRQRPPVRSETRRRWICPTCSPLSTMLPCTCASAANIYCQECSIDLANQDDVYYDFNDFMKRDRIPSPDPTCCKKSECVDYCYSCWGCGVRGSPPYDGLFMCGWCLGKVGYADLHPRDIRPLSWQSCSVPIEAGDCAEW